MNNLGLSMAWCAVQVSLLLVPAVAIHALASRRSPATGAWVASLALGLVVAVSLLTFIVPGRSPLMPSASAGAAPRPSVTAEGPIVSTPSEPRPDDDGGGRTGWSLATLRDIWERFETTAAAPAARCRPWGNLLAVTVLAGTGVGLLYLVIGLWGIHLCVRRSRPLGDPELIDMVRSLRDAMGCRRQVEVRESFGLTSPATAGWWRVVVLLPGDWRSWDEHERRAVLAHELAHIGRDDYATGILARLALAIHFYHPLVHWLAMRLLCEQELAADAAGARFAGGNGRYLLSLSRLALRQDGRSPCGPARTFLPAKGTLIRRITMLREESLLRDRPWSAARRAVWGSLLLALTGGVLTLHGPVRGDDVGKVDGEVTTATREFRSGDSFRNEPFDLSYVPEGAQGFVAVRPAAVFRRAGMGLYRTQLNLLIAQQWSKAANKLGFDPTKPGLGPLRVEMFEQVVSLFRIFQGSDVKPRWRLTVGGEGELLLARTTEAVDWIGILRAFKQELVEVGEGNRVYYRLKNPVFGPNTCIHCPDDRTVVLGREKDLLSVWRRTTPAPLPFAQGKGWDRSLRGLLLCAFDSRDGLLRTASFDAEAPYNRDVPNLFKDGGLLTFSLDDSDEIVFGGVTTLSSSAASESTARAIPTFLKALCEQASPSEPGPPKGEASERARRMWLDLLTNCRVERDGQSVIFRSSGLGTIADFASLVAAGAF